MAIAVIEMVAAGDAHLGKTLAAEGFQVHAATHVDQVRSASIALLACPGGGSEMLEAISALRLRHPGAVVIVATGRDEPDERLACYEAGADDCLAGPVRVDELVAKLRAWRRRRSGDAAFPLIAAGDAIVDLSALELKVAGRSQSLTKREAELLAILVRAGDEPVPRERVLREAWGGPAWMTSNSVDVYVGYVRRKLDLLDSNVTVTTVRGQGFRLARRKDRRRAPEPPAPLRIGSPR
ncbi:response regulator transcription factor [Chelatococcus sambhunathii]|uniref:Response regulator transcription factor n=1 Tax=Chelatococcus sambhunathii TaxID=363953 RepID=A0ABU1DIP9_9HYPH|nr:response regulator transcription factor [Chelatococcus sambhunathii]MDR4307988.1 response regulator transcription factor [Chelatococcus sambhunathii]